MADVGQCRSEVTDSFMAIGSRSSENVGCRSVSRVWQIRPTTDIRKGIALGSHKPVGQDRPTLTDNCAGSALRLLDTVPLDPRLIDTPLDPHAPQAPVRIKRDGDLVYFEVIRCPYCGEQHTHGWFKDGPDPLTLLGGRVAHCDARPVDTAWDGVAEYRLVAIHGPISDRQLDAHFPMVRYPDEDGAIDGTGRSERVAFPSAIRAIVWEKSGGHCWYCGIQTNPFADFCVDHFIPLALGGSNQTTNLVPCCVACNAVKGGRTLDGFRRRTGRSGFWFEWQE